MKTTDVSIHSHIHIHMRKRKKKIRSTQSTSTGHLNIIQFTLCIETIWIPKRKYLMECIDKNWKQLKKSFTFYFIFYFFTSFDCSISILSFVLLVRTYVFFPLFFVSIFAVWIVFLFSFLCRFDMCTTKQTERESFLFHRSPQVHLKFQKFNQCNTHNHTRTSVEIVKDALTNRICWSNTISNS